MDNPSIDQKVHQLRGVHVPLPKNPNSVGSWDDMYIEDAGNGKVRIDVYGTDPQGNPRHSVDELDEETYERVRADLLRKEQATLPAFSSIKSGNTVGRLIGETAPSTLPAVHANPPIEAETEDEGITGEQILDGIQIGLDVIGLIPVFGEAADIINAGVSLARGDYTGAALSLVSAIPFGGWFGTAGKVARRAASPNESLKALPKPAPVKNKIESKPPRKNHETSSDGAKIKGSEKSKLDKSSAEYRYRRGKFRKGVRETAWDNAKKESPDGIVRDPTTNKPLNKNEPWDMGHKPGLEHRKHMRSAEKRDLTRKEFLDEFNNPSHYRPELPSSNRSHEGEIKSDLYFGP